MSLAMTTPLEGDLLRTFLAVVETGNFTRAGDEIGRTQSAVSMQVKRLEDGVGEPLFERRSRGVALTERGKRLVPYARRIVSLLDEAAAVLHMRPLDGPVRIGIPEEYGQSVLPCALAGFAERHPAVEVTTRFAYSSQRLLAALEEDELDLAVVFDWNKRTIGEVLCIDSTVWVTSIVHHLQEQDPVPVAVYRNSNWVRDFALRSLEQHGLACRVAVTSETSGGLRLAVQSGLAISPLSRSNIPANCRELTSRDGFPMVDSSRVVLRRNPHRSSPAIEGMVQMIREAFRPMQEMFLDEDA